MGYQGVRMQAMEDPRLDEQMISKGSLTASGFKQCQTAKGWRLCKKPSFNSGRPSVIDDGDDISKYVLILKDLPQLSF